MSLPTPLPEKLDRSVRAKRPFLLTLILAVLTFLVRFGLAALYSNADSAAGHTGDFTCLGVLVFAAGRIDLGCGCAACIVGGIHAKALGAGGANCCSSVLSSQLLG